MGSPPEYQGVPGRVTGRSLEILLNYTHSMYRSFGGVMVEHNGIRGRWVHDRKHGRQFRADPSKSAPDYYGCIRGRFVGFDAKSVRSKRTWKLDREQRHQYERLMSWAQAGALCWFAVEDFVGRTLNLIRVDPDHPVVGGQPSIRFPAQPSTGVLIVTEGTQGYYDWLRAVSQSWLVDQ